MERLKDISIIDSINRVGDGNFEKYLERAAARVVIADYLHHKHCFGSLGHDRAQKIHARIFTVGIEKVIKEMMIQLGLIRVTNIEELVRIITYLYANELRFLSTDKKGPDWCELKVKTCPFLHYVKLQFNEPDGSPYFQSLWNAEKQQILQIGNLTGLSGHLSVEQESYMCNGDDECTVVLRTGGKSF